MGKKKKDGETAMEEQVPTIVSRGDGPRPSPQVIMDLRAVLAQSFDNLDRLADRNAVIADVFAAVAYRPTVVILSRKRSLSCVSGRLRFNGGNAHLWRELMEWLIAKNGNDSSLDYYRNPVIGCAYWIEDTPYDAAKVCGSGVRFTERIADAVFEQWRTGDFSRYAPLVPGAITLDILRLALNRLDAWLARSFDLLLAGKRPDKQCRDSGLFNRQGVVEYIWKKLVARATPDTPLKIASKDTLEGVLSDATKRGKLKSEWSCDNHPWYTKEWADAWIAAEGTKRLDPEHNKRERESNADVERKFKHR